MRLMGAQVLWNQLGKRENTANQNHQSKTVLESAHPFCSPRLIGIPVIQPLHVLDRRHSNAIGILAPFISTKVACI